MMSSQSTKIHARLSSSSPTATNPPARVIYKHLKRSKTMHIPSYIHTHPTPHTPPAVSICVEKEYVAFGDVVDASRTQLTLSYPTTPPTAEAFPLIVPKKSEEYSPIHDLVDTIKALTQFAIPQSISEKIFGTSKQGLLRRIIKASNRRNVPDLVLALEEFNKEIAALPPFPVSEWVDGESGEILPNPFEISTHILEQSYSRVVSPYAETLIVKGFSNTVYGELRPKLVDEFIRVLKPKPGMVFMDLGSGVGNIVLQFASQCLCESYGVEIQPQVHTLATSLLSEFQTRHRLYNRALASTTLIHSDFLSSQKVDSTLRRTDILFINNYIFSPTLNQSILAKFLDLKEGCRIISLRPFVPVGKPCAPGTIEGILTPAVEYFYGRDRVSWTFEGGSWFMTQVRRDRGEELEDRMKSREGSSTMQR